MVWIAPGCLNLTEWKLNICRRDQRCFDSDKSCSEEKSKIVCGVKHKGYHSDNITIFYSVL